MRIIKVLILLIVSIYLISCKYDKNNDFLVVNMSGNNIDSLKISCSGTDYKNKSNFINLSNNDSILVNLDMNNLKKIDGNYFIELFFKDKIVNKDFGYYSNGVPTNSIYKLVVKNDTIIVSESMK